MKSLLIEELPRKEELDSNAMATIQGGRMNLHNLVVSATFPSAPSMIDPIGPWNDFLLPHD